MAHGTIKRRVRILKSLSKHVDLFDKEAVVKFLNICIWSNGTKNIAVLAYKGFLRMYGLPELKLAKFYVTDRLLFFQLEKQSDALINVLRQKLVFYLQSSKEAGVRPIEAWSLK